MFTTLTTYGHGQRAGAANGTPDTPICQGLVSFNSLLNAIVTDYSGAGSRSSLLHYEATLGKFWKTVDNNLPSDLQADAAKVMPVYRNEFNVWLKEGGKPNWLLGKHESVERPLRALAITEKPVSAYLHKVCLTG